MDTTRGHRKRRVSRPRNLSAVAAIIDAQGGYRVVVTQRWRMRAHLAKGERLIVVPDFKVREPVPPSAIHAVCERARIYAAQQLALSDGLPQP